MESSRIAKPPVTGEELLLKPLSEAARLFQSYSLEQQMQIVEATRDPRKREELYYLVPDGTELVQRSRAVDLLQITQAMLGTGLNCGILSAVTGSQLEEMIDLSVWRDGKLDHEMASLWLTELAECDEDDLMRLLPEVDMRILTELVRDRVDIRTEFKGLFVETGLVGVQGLEYDDEQARMLMELLWAVDEDMFFGVLRELFTEPEPVPEEYEDIVHELRIDDAQADRDERVRERDRKAGLAVDEQELFEEVDLNDLPLKRSKKSKRPRKKQDD